MTAQRRGWTKKLGHATWLSGALFALMATNDDNGCGPQQADNANRAECQVAADCKGDPGVDCVGAWACNTGECEFQCGDQPPVETGCYSDSDCTTGLVCNAADVCHQPPGCNDGASCVAVCYGECVKPGDPDPTKCTSSAQCPPGDYCTTETGSCDSNCAPGATCPAVCWGDCKPKENGAVCYDDSECANGQVCDRDPCVFPDADPASGDKMVACGGVCRDREGCNTNDDCPADETCGCAAYPGEAPANGLVPCFLQCLPSKPVCSSDADCKDGQVCQNGACTDKQQECNADQDCPSGWACQSSCGNADADSNGDVPSGNGGAALPYCPSYCVPQGGTCADTGVTCAPGETCVNDCYTVCPDCNCPEGDADCACGECWQECRSACVPDQGSCDDSQCPSGTHCGCPNSGPTPANGLYYCDQKCVPDDVTCTVDSDCGDGNYCLLPEDCGTWAGPTPDCDPNSESCGQRPAPPACTGTCQPKQPEYDCKDDSGCIAADGTQGFCKYDVCEANAARPCPADDPSCGAPPPPVCYGWCVYPTEPETCDPANDTCARGTHCEATGGCGGGGGGADFMPCFMQWQCVPDEQKCDSDCDCDPSLACNDGICERMGRINTCGLSTDCTSDAQCADGQYCDIDPNQPVCDCVGCGCDVPHGTCKPKDEPVGCQADSDCKDGELCGCGTDPSCPMCDVCLMQCMPKVVDPGDCKADSDCGEGQQCKLYYPPCAAPEPDANGDFAVPPACDPIGRCEPQDEPKCKVTGCSGTVCSDHDVITTCEYFDYYQCYKYAICDIGGDGTCGWQKTDDFVSCMARYNQ